MAHRGPVRVLYILRALLALLVTGQTSTVGQSWDLGGLAADAISGSFDNRLKLSFEQRGRYEIRGGTGFGTSPDVATGLIRTRLGLSYTPSKWLKLSVMGQDARAPWYGPNAPNNLRDQADLHEAYVQLFHNSKSGFGAAAGRMMLDYGDGRIIGTPQWGNLARTYDQARVSWRGSGMRLEVLLVSPVKIRIGEFNRVVLGDRVWGTYNAFPDLFHKSQLDVYVLRRDQNRPGGFTGGTQSAGTDRLGINTFGFRVAGPLDAGVKFTLEAAYQSGKVGAAEHHAGAWVLGLNRRWQVKGRPLDILSEYKFASGTTNPSDPKHSGTFDQLYAANHDKFGHEDLFGWRNMHNARSLASLGVTRNFAIHFMYDSYWLAARKDGIYNLTGRLIARSAAGDVGRHVGQETDLFGTYKFGRFTFGAGYGRFFSGEFMRKTTPGIGPNYLYLFHTYTL